MNAQRSPMDLHEHIRLLQIQLGKINRTKVKIAQLQEILEEETRLYTALTRQTQVVFDNVKKDVDIESDNCPICLEEITTSSSTLAYIVECRHTFHKKCLTPWLKEHKKTCPMCRHSPITTKAASAEAVLFGKKLFQDFNKI